MTITTKYNLGDTVWILHQWSSCTNREVACDTVAHILISSAGVLYRIRRTGGLATEAEVFPTRAEAYTALNKLITKATP